MANPSFVVTVQEDEKGQLRAFLFQGAAEFRQGDGFVPDEDRTAGPSAHRHAAECDPLRKPDPQGAEAASGDPEAIDAIYQTKANNYATLMFG